MPRENRRRTRRNIREPLSRRETADPSTSGSNSPIQQRATSRVPAQHREPEEQMPRTSRRRQNMESTHRGRSRSPIDQNHLRPSPSDWQREEHPGQIPRRSRRLQNMQSTQRDRSRSPIDRNHRRPSPSNLQREEHPACQVCLQRLLQEEQTITTPCTHVFHSTCLSNWCVENNKCPVCQEELLWNIEEEYELPYYGKMKISAPFQILSRKLSFSIDLNDREPRIYFFPEQDYPIIGSVASLWGRELEDQTGSSQGERSQQREEQDACSICFDDLHEEAETTRLPCSHCFHTSCITTWMQERTTCPLCRERITWNIKNSFNLPNYGVLTITTSGRFWSMNLKIQIDYQRGVPYLVIWPPFTEEEIYL